MKTITEGLIMTSRDRAFLVYLATGSVWALLIQPGAPWFEWTGPGIFFLASIGMTAERKPNDANNHYD